MAKKAIFVLTVLVAILSIATSSAAACKPTPTPAPPPTEPPPPPTEVPPSAVPPTAEPPTEPPPTAEPSETVAPATDTQVPPPMDTPTEAATATETVAPPPGNTPVPTEASPTWKFDFQKDTGCVEPFLRVHNENPVSVKVDGEIWAGNQLVAKVTDATSLVGPDQWGGPEGDMPKNFEGMLTGWIKVYYNGSEVARDGFNVEKHCAFAPTATGTPLSPEETRIPPTGGDPEEGDPPPLVCLPVIIALTLFFGVTAAANKNFLRRELEKMKVKD